MDRPERDDALTAAKIRQALEEAVRDMTDNPLLAILFRGEEGPIISRLLSQEKLAAHDCDEERFIGSLLDVLRRKGFRPRSDPATIRGCFTSYGSRARTVTPCSAKGILR
jgi:hypothetical protein